jgi:hypothetical protein
MRSEPEMKLRVKQDFVYNGNQPELKEKTLFKQDEVVTNVNWLANMYLEAKSTVDEEYHLIAQPFMLKTPLEDPRFTAHFEVLNEAEEEGVAIP